MADVLSIIGSIVGILTAAEASYNGIKDINRLPQAFKEIGKILPIVLDTLRQLSQQSVPEDANTGELEALATAVDICKDKAEKLGSILEQLEPEDPTSLKDRYVTILRLWGKKARVEELMKDILREVHVLACHRIMRLATAGQLEEAMKEIRKVQPSDEEVDDRGSMNANYGSIGHQNNSFGNNNTSHHGSGHIISGSTVNFPSPKTAGQ